MNTPALIPVLAAGLNSCIGNILLKWSRTSLPAESGLADKLLSIGFIGALAFFGVSTALFAKALESMEVSVAYPVSVGFGFAMLSVASHYILGEPFYLHKWMGLGLVLAGIIFLAGGG